MILTGLEIKNLAEYALGITLNADDFDYDNSNLDEYEFSLSRNVEVQDDDGTIKTYGVVVRCDGCEGNECIPISED